ncbi:MAG: phosphotransferase [Nannocystaceae bacterium]
MELLPTIIERLSPGAHVDGVRTLTGGVSSSVVAVDFTRADGVRERVVVRRRGDHAWKPDTPGGIAREHALLGRLHALGLPVPRPRLLDPCGALVLDFVDGDPGPPAGLVEGPAEAQAWPMAELLAAIHGAPIDGLPALPRRDDPRPELLAWLPAAPGLAAALRRAGEPRGPATLLHGDFWPGNLLWRDGAIVAALDWEDAAVGDPLSDLACARVEIECAAGEAVARAFADRYRLRSGADLSRLPVWDLYVSTAALASMDAWGLPAEVLAARRRVTAAFQGRAWRALGLEGSLV